MVENRTRLRQRPYSARISGGLRAMTGMAGAGLNNAVRALFAMAKIRNPAKARQSEMGTGNDLKT